MKRLFGLLVLAAVFAGCSLDGGNETTITLGFGMEADTPPAFLFTFDDGQYRHALTREDFAQTNAHSFRAGPFPVSMEGTIRVTCTVFGEDGSARASEVLRLALRPDWGIQVSGTIGSNNPYRRCFGCKGFKAQALDPADGFAPGDSLFLVWSGNSISSPVLY